MYIIAWTDADGTIYRRTERYVTDATDLINMIAYDSDRYGIGVQFETVDEVFALMRRLDGIVPFEGQAAGESLSYLGGAEADFAIVGKRRPAPFMRYPMPEER